MPMDHSGDLMQALVAKLYSIITGDDKAIKIPRNKFVSWFLPGVPFDPKDFTFCAKGFTADTAEAIQEAYHQAFVLSKLFDFIPEVSNEFVTDEMQQMLYAGTQDTISSVYSDVLKYSRVLHTELSAEEEAKLKKFRDLLSVEVPDIIDETRMTVKPGKLTIAYAAMMKEYIDAVDEYASVRADALAASGSDPESKRRVQVWAVKEPILRKRLDAAWLAWTAQGYKSEYEQIAAYIEQVTQKSLVLYKKDLQEKLRAGVMSSPSDGPFHYTTLLPGHFATSEGWTKFSFSEADTEVHSRKKTSQWSAGGSAGFGLFSVGGKGGGSKVRSERDAKLSKFSAKFEFTQIPICRPWFEPGFLWMRSWTLDKHWDLSFGKAVSDGAEKPAGRCVAYPVSALFARGVELCSSDWSSQLSLVDETIGGGGSAGYGPFRLSGSYQSGKQDRKFKSEVADDILTIPGIQLIGFINNVIPLCPNLNPEIKPEDLV